MNYLKKNWDLIKAFFNLDRVLIIILYTFTFIVIANNIVISSDRLQEYNSFLSIINKSSNTFKEGLVSSSLFATWLPAQIHLLTGLDKQLAFAIIPILVYPLMSVFVYKISRIYLNAFQSLSSALLIVASFYFAFFSSVGRLGIGWAFLAIAIWAILKKKYTTASLISILLTLAHYGSAFYFVFILGLVWLYLLYKFIRKKELIQLKGVSIVFSALCISAGIWYFIIAAPAGDIVKGFIYESVSMQSQTLLLPIETPAEVPPPEPGQADPSLAPVAPEKPLTQAQIKTTNFLRLESRDPVIQAAFGKGFFQRNAGQKIEFFLTWLIVFVISYGLLVLLRSNYDLMLKIFALAMYFSIVLTLVIPHISVYYGAGRVYFTALITLSTCFVIGITDISKRIKVNQYILLNLIVVPYYFTVAGYTHTLLGVVK